MFDCTKKRRQPTKSNGDPLKNFYLNNLIGIPFRKGSRNMFYQTIHQIEYTELDLKDLMCLRKLTAFLIAVASINQKTDNSS